MRTRTDFSSMRRPASFVALALALPLAGCLGDQPAGAGQEIPGPGTGAAAVASVRQFNATFNLTATRNIPGPGPVDGIVYGLVMDERDCAFMVVEKRGWSYRILRGNASLEWAAPDQALAIRLAGGHLNSTTDLVTGDNDWWEEETPAGPSPVVADFKDIGVDIDAPFMVAAVVASETTDLTVAAKLHVEFDYEGNDVLALQRICSKREPI